MNKIRDFLLGVALALVLIVLTSELANLARWRRYPDPAGLLDGLVDAQKWSVWAAAEDATRHPVIEGECTDAAG